MKDIDTILEETHGNGAYQVTYLLLASITGFVCMSELVSANFMKYSPEFECTAIDLFPNITLNELSRLNYTVELSTSQCYAKLTNSTDHAAYVYPCVKWNFSTEVMKKTLVTDENLVCHRKSLIPMLNSGYLLFSGLGYIISMAGDTIGRRKVFLLLTVLEVFTMLTCLVSSNIVYMIIVRCGRGLNAGFKHFAMACLAEVLPIDKRSLILTLWWVLWCCGALFVSLVAYLVRDWYYLRIIMLGPLIVYPLYFPLVMESPRWLLLRGKTEETLKVLKRIAKFNRAKLSDNYFSELEAKYMIESFNSRDSLSDQLEAYCVSKSINKEHLIDVFSNKTICCRLLVFLACGCSVSFSYFGLMTMSDFLSDDIFLNAALIGAMEIPALCSMFILLKFAGSKSASMFTFTGSALCILSTEFLDPFPIIKYIIANTGKILSTCAQTTFNVFIIECMPTSIRSSSMLLQVTFGLSLSSLAPFLNQLPPHIKYIRGIIYSTSLLISSFLIGFYLPETKGCPLSQTIAEAGELTKGNEAEWSKKIRSKNNK